MPERNRTFGDEEYIDAVRVNEPASTPEVADHVGCTRENARIRLLKLHENGDVERKMVRGSHIWFLE